MITCFLYLLHIMVTTVLLATDSESRCGLNITWSVVRESTQTGINIINSTEQMY